MAFSTVIVCCLLIAVASSSPLDERSAGVKVVQLNEAQKKQASDSLITILEGTVTKLKEAEADSARRSADSQGLEVTVDSAAGADLSADDLVAYLQDVADTVNGGATVNRRQLNFGAGYNPSSGFGGSLGYNYEKGNTKFGANVGYSQGGGWSGGLGLTIKF